LKKLEHIFGYCEDKKLYFVIEGEIKHYFSDRSRGFNLYKNGLINRSNTLKGSYLLDSIKFNRGDLVIDCGANYADLWLYLRGFLNEKDYITFEPGQDEFKVIKENAPYGRNYNLGLGEENEIKKLYINSEQADSSFIRPPNFNQTILAKTISLNSFFLDENIKRLKLLKLEAEGFEPEILTGAIQILPFIEYIAIDGSYERGEFCEETFSSQTNILLQHGFEMVGINFLWSRAIFKNNRF
jgi:FkbM family methyltransferase